MIFNFGFLAASDNWGKPLKVVFYAIHCLHSKVRSGEFSSTCSRRSIQLGRLQMQISQELFLLFAFPALKIRNESSEGRISISNILIRSETLLRLDEIQLQRTNSFCSRRDDFHVLIVTSSSQVRRRQRPQKENEAKRPSRKLMT